MATEDRKIKLVLKNHDCTRIGEINPFESFDAVSRVNDVGEATLVAGYGASTRNDDVLDELDTADVILEAYIQPPGHDTFLDDPAWAGFLRNRRLTQEGPTRTVTATFKDYNHLLARRVIKPPPGASHDEGYGCIPDVMRDLVRRQAAELAEEDRQFPGLSVESNECDAGGLYGADATDIVFGSNLPEWVRVNCLFEWNGHLYLGTETQSASGEYADIYRSADGITWTKVLDAPDLLYGLPITGIHCFASYGAWLYAGCSQDWFDGEALVMRTCDGTNWALAHTFPNLAGIWALEEFDGNLYAGTTGETAVGSTTYLWRSANGLVWASCATAAAYVANGCSAFGGSEQRIKCEALYTWDDYLYLGIMYKNVVCIGGGLQNCTWTYQGRVYRTDDGTTMNQMLSSASVHGFLSFMDFGGWLYAGSGRTRFDDWFCSISDVGYGTQGGQIWRSEDGAAWYQVFGQNLDDAHVSSAITQMIETTDDDGVPVLWAASGCHTGGAARIYSSTDGETWIAVIYLTKIPYNYILAIAEFSGSPYAATGCYARSAGDGDYGGTWTADFGDVWYLVPSYDDVAESGMLGRWTVLLDKLRELAEQSGRYDFGVVGLNSFLYCDDDYQEFQFRVRSPQWGTDNRWSATTGRGTSFSIQRGNMAAPDYAEIRDARPTFLYLLGPSAGEERTVEEFENVAETDDSPWNRCEGCADAQSIDSQQALQSIGWSELEQLGPYREFDFSVLETAACHYKGGWDLGDLVTAFFSNLRADCKINEASLHAREGSPVYEARAVFNVLTSEAIIIPVGWWDPDGEGFDVWGAWQGKGADSLGDSYLDLSINGNNLSSSKSPGWDTDRGWITNGTNQYMRTGFVPTNDQVNTLIVQFDNLVWQGGGTRFFAGSRSTGGVLDRSLLGVATWQNVNPALSKMYVANGGGIYTAPAGTLMTEGNLAVAGSAMYRDGVEYTTEYCLAWDQPESQAIYIGCWNKVGVAERFVKADIIAVAVYRQTLTAAQIAKVAAAMAEL